MKTDREVCVGKVRHETKAIARDAARRTRAQQTDRTRKLYTYECAECRGWHLTSMEPGTFRAMQRAERGLTDILQGARRQEDNMGDLSRKLHVDIKRPFEHLITLNAVTAFRGFVENEHACCDNPTLSRLLDDRLKAARVLDIIDREHDPAAARLAEIVIRSTGELRSVYVLLRPCLDGVQTGVEFAAVTLMTRAIVASNFAKGRWTVRDPDESHKIPQLASAQVAAPDAPPTAKEIAEARLDLQRADEVEPPPSLGERLTLAVVAERAARTEVERAKIAADKASGDLVAATQLVEDLLAQIQKARGE